MTDKWYLTNDGLFQRCKGIGGFYTKGFYTFDCVNSDGYFVSVIVESDPSKNLYKKTEYETTRDRNIEFDSIKAKYDFTT